MSGSRGWVRKLFLAFLLLLVLLTAAGAAVAYVAYLHVTRDLPKIESIQDYRPSAVSKVLAADGSVVAEFYRDRRYPVRISDVPVTVRNCFLAAEDANFYSHGGIDPLGILRAMVRNLQAGSARQGGSTITQQVVKNLLLSSEKSLKRKAQEAILSYHLEKRLTKDEILEIYLNEIFFGNTAYGIKAAAQLYFHKQLNELTLAEGAMLAALPKAPSRYSPLLNPERAKTRQRYVLQRMQEAGFATKEQVSAALREELTYFPANGQNVFAAPYFVAEVRRVVAERWPQLNIDSDGLEIHTTLNLEADALAVRALRKSLRQVDKRRGWRGPLAHYETDAVVRFAKQFAQSTDTQLQYDTPYPALVRELHRNSGTARVLLRGAIANVNLKQAAWARKRIDSQDQVTWINIEQVVRVGDVIEVVLPAPEKPAATDAMDRLSQPLEELSQAIPESRLAPKGGGTVPDLGEVLLDQSPELEGAVVVLEPATGKVLTLVGGYDYQRSVFNRATQSLRQPGSAFKPIVYLAAIDKFNYTPSTIVYDTPRTFRAGDEFWTPGNFDGKYLGGITLRSALEKSRNLVSADIISRIGIEAAIVYARKLGITSTLGKNLSLALGSSELTALELTRAYGVFAARGLLFDSVLVQRIQDRQTKTLYDADAEAGVNKAQQAISENSAFIMANLMRGVIERGTGTRVRALGRPVAGKTGTSNDQMDAWFVGFTPTLVAGVWVGFDQKKEIGPKETGGAVAAPVFLDFMKAFLDRQEWREYQAMVEEAKNEAQRLGVEYIAPEPLEPLEFSVPDGVDPFWVDRETGVLTSADNPVAFKEYFLKGTEPTRSAPDQATSTSYLDAPDL
jgi:penicillin-binding protein 1A